MIRVAVKKIHESDKAHWRITKTPKQLVASRDVTEGNNHAQQEKCGTHVRVWSSTLPHGNSKHKIRKVNRVRRQAKKSEQGRKNSWRKMKKSGQPTV